MSNGQKQQSPPRPEVLLAMQKLRQASALHQQGQLAQAEALYREVLAAVPNQSDALHFLGVLEIQRGQPDSGLALIERAIAANPRNVAALYNRGNFLRDRGRLDDALASFDLVIGLKSDHVGAHNNRGVLLHDLGRHSEAIESYNRSLALKPDHVDALCNRGAALIELRRFEEALSSYDRALAIAQDAAAHFGRGNALVELGRHVEALSAFDRTLTFSPDDARVHNNRGTALERLNRYEEAIAAFDRAVQYDPRHVVAFNSRANLYIQLKRFSEALASYDLALRLKPDYPEALYGRGYALIELKRHDEAIASFRHLLEIRPSHPYALGMLLHATRTACDWLDDARLVSLAVREVKEGKRSQTPLAFFAVSDSNEDNTRCSKILIGDKFKPPAVTLWRGERYRHQRVRIAYISADFNTHAVATQMVGVFEHHDRTRFETFALSHGLNDNSEMRRRLEQAFDHFIDARNKSDNEIASFVHAEEIDILVDLTGLTGRGRPGVLALRPAGLQVQHLGLAGSMGADFVDYIIADTTVIPESQRQNFSEKAVYLPDTYLPNDSARAVAEKLPSRAEAGLPASGFVFCSFNNSYKFSPAMFDVWMRLLAAVEHSVLWLPEANETARRNLAREAEMRGVLAERLIFAPYVNDPAAHLARLSLGDLFLDTLPYNAHSTASDALWAGLPVLTTPGGSFAGRVAASLLRAAGLPELVAESVQAYEDRALRLAREPALLAELRLKLSRNRTRCPLFDTKQFTRHLEAAYAGMIDRHRRGQPPESFAIERADTAPS